MAFHSKKEVTSSSLEAIFNYQQYLKKEDDPILRSFKTPDGYYLNIVRIDSTPEEQKMSLAVEQFNKNYQSIIQEQDQKE